MGMRETLQAEIARLEAEHEKNVAAYQAAREEAAQAETKLRALKDVGFTSSNELATAKKALADLDRLSPVREIKAAGDVGG